MSRVKRSTALLVSLLAAALIAAGAGLFLTEPGRALLGFPTREERLVTSLQKVWGVDVPGNIEIVERHSTNSFQGDDDIITVVKVIELRSLEGTDLDPSSLSSQPLTSRERSLVDRLDRVFAPTHTIDLNQSQVRKLSKRASEPESPDELAVVLLDEVSGLYHIYESRF